MRVLRVSFLSGFALELLASISVAIVAVSIGFRLLDGSLTLTVGLFVLLLAPEAYWPVRRVGQEFHAAADGAEAHVVRVGASVGTTTTAEAGTSVEALIVAADAGLYRSKGARRA